MKIASYNIRKGIGLDRKREPARILKVINEMQADIVILQEADRRVGNRASAIPLDLLHEYTNYKVADVSIREQSIGWHGNAILVKRQHQVLATARIDLPILEPRGAVVADVKTPDGYEVRIVGAHLALLPRIQSRQITHLLETVYDMGTHYPTIVGGDFNEWKRQNAAYDIKGEHFSIKEVGYSYHASLPFVGLDRFIVSGGVEILQGGVHKSPLSQKASDHLPIWVDVSLKETMACGDQSNVG